MVPETDKSETNTGWRNGCCTVVVRSYLKEYIPFPLYCTIKPLTTQPPLLFANPKIHRICPWFHLRRANEGVGEKHVADGRSYSTPSQGRCLPRQQVERRGDSSYPSSRLTLSTRIVYQSSSRRGHKYGEQNFLHFRLVSAYRDRRVSAYPMGITHVT